MRAVLTGIAMRVCCRGQPRGKDCPIGGGLLSLGTEPVGRPLLSRL